MKYGVKDWGKGKTIAEFATEKERMRWTIEKGYAFMDGDRVDAGRRVALYEVEDEDVKYTEEQKQLAISYLERRSKLTSLETGIASEAVMNSYFNMLEITDGMRWLREQDPLQYADELCEEAGG